MLGVFLIFNLGDSGLLVPSFEIRLFVFALTFAATFFMPLISVLVLLKAKQITSLEMSIKEERRLPYLITAMFYFVESYLLTLTHASGFVNSWILGSTLLILIVMVINLFWKISAHMVAIGGLCGMMIALSYRLQINLHYQLILLFTIAGLVGFARLKPNSHSPSQVYVGFLLGVSTELFLFV